MTEQIVERLEQVGGYVQELPEDQRPLPCFVRHEHAGGQCGEPGTMLVYGLVFCEAHGAEARAGCFAELYHDATDVLGGYDHSFTSSMNSAAGLVEGFGVPLLAGKCAEAERSADEGARKAYAPSEQVREMAARFCEDEDHPAYAADHVRSAQFLLHKLMRKAYDAGATWIVELLERERESQVALLAAVLEIEERHYQRV